MKNLAKLKSRCAVVTAGLMVAASLSAPVCAFADQNAGTAQSTDVTIQSVATSGGQTTSDDNLTFSTPTVIPFSANSKGEMTGPSAAATQIINKSIFPVHVTKMAVAEQDPFHIVDDVTASTGANDVQFTIHGAKAAASVDLSADAAWNMGYAGSTTDHIDLDTSNAKIARVTADLSSPQKAATITWTLASGNAQ